jgi:predicted nucleic acid-binding protein
VILADTSVWIEHLNRGHRQLAVLLEQGEVLVHPMVIGELACGNIRNREEVLELVKRLPGAAVATNEEALHLIEEGRLMGSGLGYIDVHLLAAVLLTGDARLWTNDARLSAVASRMFVRYDPV